MFSLQLEWERQLFRNVKYCEACRSEGVKATPSLEQDDCFDYQEIKIQVYKQLDLILYTLFPFYVIFCIQEKLKTDTRSCYAVGLKVILLDDLVDKCRPGDNVDIRLICYLLSVVKYIQNVMLNIASEIRKYKFN